MNFNKKNFYKFAILAERNIFLTMVEHDAILLQHAVIKVKNVLQQLKQARLSGATPEEEINERFGLIREVSKYLDAEIEIVHARFEKYLELTKKQKTAKKQNPKTEPKPEPEPEKKNEENEPKN